MSAVEVLGQRQAAILIRMRWQRAHGFARLHLLRHGRRGNADRLAARRLVQRGLLAGPWRIGAGPWHNYELTERGRSCWIQVKP